MLFLILFISRFISTQEEYFKEISGYLLYHPTTPYTSVEFSNNTHKNREYIGMVLYLLIDLTST